MRRLGVWGLSAALLLGLAASAALAATKAEDDDEDAKPAAPASSGFWSWWGNLFGSRQSAPAKPDKPAPPKKDTTKVVTPAKPVDSVTARLAQERDRLLRRQAVCVKLEQIALDTNDQELQRMAEELDDRAYALYLKRTAALAAAGPDESAHDAPTETDVPLRPHGHSANALSARTSTSRSAEENP